MSLANARPGANYVPAYQASGIPFIATAGTGATKTIEFNKVTLEVTVANAGTDSSTVNFGLTNSTDFTIPANSVATFRVKTKKIVITSGANSVTSVMASLTEIDGGLIPTYDQSDYGSAS